MHLFPRFFQFSLITITSYVRCLVRSLPSNAAISTSKTTLIIENFSILPQNSNASSNREAIAFTGNELSLADAAAEGTLNFTNEKNNPFLRSDFNSSASGNGSNYFSFGESNSFFSNTFLVDQNETLSFNFAVFLALENKVNSNSDGSVNTYTEVSFSLFDDIQDAFLGEFLAIGNLDTNLANSINNDVIFASSNLNVFVDSFIEEKSLAKNREFANLEITGNIEQTFTTATQIRLQANTFNISCTQSVKNNDPCIRTTVNESNNALPTTVVSIGIALFFKKKLKNY